MKTVVLNAGEIRHLMMPVNGEGGWQDLLTALQAAYDPSNGTIELSDDMFEKIPRYAFEYGNGGWEERLVGIFGRHLGPGLGR